LNGSKRKEKNRLSEKIKLSGKAEKKKGLSGKKKESITLFYDKDHENKLKKKPFFFVVVG